MYLSIAEALPSLTLEPANAVVRQQRIIKTFAEQALLRRAAGVSDTGLRAARGRIREGVTELEVCAAGIAAAIEAGADFVRYLRVHSGPYSSFGSRWPQAMPRIIERGDLVRLANGLLEQDGYGKHARTFMGHGIGLETVEEPYLTPEITTPLEPGMVICVEPGVYIPGWGGASIEQEVIITEGAPTTITPTPARQWA